jgi:hypothetical protein
MAPSAIVEHRSLQQSPDSTYLLFTNISTRGMNYALANIAGSAQAPSRPCSGSFTPRRAAHAPLAALNTVETLYAKRRAGVQRHLTVGVHAVRPESRGEGAGSAGSPGPSGRFPDDSSRDPRPGRAYGGQQRYGRNAGSEVSPCSGVGGEMFFGGVVAWRRRRRWST